MVLEIIAGIVGAYLLIRYWRVALKLTLWCAAIAAVGVGVLVTL